MNFKPYPAIRATAAEILESYHIFSIETGDGEKPAKFALLPTGERANNVFIIGTLTAVKSDDRFVTGTLFDKTGKIKIRTSAEYQPAAYDQLSRIAKTLPAHVAVCGRIAVFEPQEKKENSPDRFVSIQAEGLAMVERSYRDDWDQEVHRETIRRYESWNIEHLTDDQKRSIEVYGPGIRENVMQRVRSAYEQAPMAE
ncbi:hypothetical protein ACKUB1_17870 [Methanospirillum stamsii]|uniref:Nucleic acid-binding protein n=1 Tax=Methanospirillum stamsii TaxID=1277351 RepID=A0A2V2MZP6_9EURY|nr:hypothetical protein [Methanospirillum stamsii]PWR73362.1 hypothetical protein DLD82_10880 [Methanospirillum stamsii]